MKKSRAFGSLALLGLCCILGCRVERSVPASPFAAGASSNEDSEPRDDAGSGGTTAAGSGGVGLAGASGSGGMVAAAPDGGEHDASGQAGVGGSGGMGGRPIEPDASIIGDACDPEVLFCNPVTNEGCPAPMQCAVDLLAAELTGYCIFNGPVADGCFNSGVTESCPPMQACLNFECRALCFCDHDCEEGQCCVDPVGDLGFKACGKC